MATSSVCGRFAFLDAQKPSFGSGSNSLSGLDSFADSSTWADDESGIRPDTTGWHFIDIPRGAPTFSVVGCQTAEGSAFQTRFISRRDGRAFDGTGVPPDIEIPVFTAEDLASGRDSGLDSFGTVGPQTQLSWLRTFYRTPLPLLESFQKVLIEISVPRAKISAGG